MRNVASAASKLVTRSAMDGSETEAAGTMDEEAVAGTAASVGVGVGGMGGGKRLPGGDSVAQCLMCASSCRMDVSKPVCSANMRVPWNLHKKKKKKKKRKKIKNHRPKVNGSNSRAFHLHVVVCNPHAFIPSTTHLPHTVVSLPSVFANPVVW